MGKYVCEPRWLKAKEAAHYAALGVKRLKQLAIDPACPILGAQDPDSARGDWIFDRHSLDRYRLNQVSDTAVDAAAARIAQDIGL